MYTAHIAAGLAVKGAVPEAPTPAILVGAFLPDFLWIVLAGVGVEPADPKIFFDGWSHSLLSILVQASVFAVLFRGRGARVMAALWVAVFSHFLFDFLIHPRPLQLYPHSSMRLGWDLWDWGQSALGSSTHYWWVEWVPTLILLAAYVVLALRKRLLPANLVAANCLIVLGLRFVF